MDKYYLAVDIGASSTSSYAGKYERRENAAGRGIPFPEWNDRKNGTLCWDVERLFTEIKTD